MLMVFRAALLLICLSVCGHAQMRMLALYPGAARDLHADSTSALQVELQRLLTPAGLSLIWKNFEDRTPGENFELLAVISFKGGCSAVEAPSGAAETSASLGDTLVSAGNVLPFFNVDCGHLVKMLWPQLETMEVRARPALLGRALARVMAHEIYHIVGQTVEHQMSGVAKAAFSLRDLTGSRFEFDIWSIARMRPASMVAMKSLDSVQISR